MSSSLATTLACLNAVTTPPFPLNATLVTNDAPSKPPKHFSPRQVPHVQRSDCRHTVFPPLPIPSSWLPTSAPVSSL
ncbi:hypothetical protein PF005_g17678 [Phytophthora fragariae]|uniref:Uncharacterized protein n=1 Tax=Phytophthora fragariae TaxID=53985 RepID=A0A6A3SZE6_9STRA|nr:hypothetical protein PF003_g14326 [Phytophthora fragariae]KAE8931119.1 hypothetical protein PF009_g18806 [Phytophthora fragariae]KAE8994857.1 hypothetical protein PF011_g16570 [Phytophthora fragariae]KAE9094330.1 hypothetical protein PF010_g17144 [Phytophthora fragariae]KAE9094586.1 hypothetical protein PF007_g17709 [Phytophthora fragariae]